VITTFDFAWRVTAVAESASPLGLLQAWIEEEVPDVRAGGLAGLAREAQRCWEVIESNKLGRNTDGDARRQLLAIAAGVLRGEPA
jgi:hypothetical protein